MVRAVKIKKITRKKLKWWEKLDKVKSRDRLSQLNKHNRRLRSKSEFIAMAESIEARPTKEVFK